MDRDYLTWGVALFLLIVCGTVFYLTYQQVTHAPPVTTPRSL